MKNLLISGICLWLAIACAETEKPKAATSGTGNFTYDSLSFKHYFSDSDQYVEVYYKLPDFKGEGKIQDSLRSLVLSLIVADSAENLSGIKQIMEADSRQFESEYKDFIAETPETNLPFSRSLSCTVLNESPNIISLRFEIYEYSGGAHGNYGTFVYNLNSKDGSTLTSADLITNKTGFTNLAEELFRKRRNIGPDENMEDLGYWFKNNVFAVNENFLIEKDTIRFFYNPYEITSFSEGVIELPVSKKEARKFLNKKIL